MTLEPGQSLDLDTRVDGGMVLTRDPAGDVLSFDREYREVSEYEIKVQVKGDSPEEVVRKLNETVIRLKGTHQNLRDIDPERREGEV